MDDETRARRDRCDTFLLGDGRVLPSQLLASVGESVVPDTYGDGGVVAELEAFVADLLGVPAAVFLPSGTMAQAATLRVHADQRGRRTVLWHPTCHLRTHEGDAYSRVHALVGRTVGDPHRLLTRDDLGSVAEPVAALLLELPQRDLGGQLPVWDDLADQLAWAHDHGAATHLDGARLWEASAGYGRPPAEIASFVRHGLRLVLHGHRRPVRVLRGRACGRGGVGARVAAPAGRHPARDVARGRVGPAPAARPARRDAGAADARPGDRGRAGRRGGHPGDP